MPDTPTRSATEAPTTLPTDGATPPALRPGPLTHGVDQVVSHGADTMTDGADPPATQPGPPATQPGPPATQPGPPANLLGPSPTRSVGPPTRNVPTPPAAGRRTGGVADEGWPTVIRVVPWVDPLIDRLGHDPRSLYVETFWLGVLGPSACDFSPG